MTPCVCPLAGYCETHKRTMSAVRHAECRDKPGFFEAFQIGLARRNGEPLPAPKPVTLDCVHRGDVIRQGVGDLCGRKGETFDVFACSIHGECALSRFCKKQREQSCAKCPDRTE